MDAITLNNRHLYIANKTCINVLDVSGGSSRPPMRSLTIGDGGVTLTLIRVYEQLDMVVAGDWYGRVHIWCMSTGVHVRTLRNEHVMVSISDVVVHEDTLVRVAVVRTHARV
jgi:hypothetical protein